MEQNILPNGLLNINLTLSLTPDVVIENKQAVATTAEGDALPAGKFLISSATTLSYSALGRTLNDLLAGRRYVLSRGLIPVYIVVQNIEILGNEAGRLSIAVRFNGTATGTLTVSGKPVYPEGQKMMVLQHPDYHIKTNNWLLKGAKMVLAGRIEKELLRVASVSLGTQIAAAEAALSHFLTKEWTKAINSAGKVHNLRITGLKALPQHLLVEISCEGNLAIILRESLLNFQHGSVDALVAQRKSGPGGTK